MIYIFIVEIILNLVVLFAQFCCYLVETAHSLAYIIEICAQLSHAVVQLIKKTCDFLC